MNGRRLVRAGEPSLVTIPNVEVLEVGMDWETSTGIFTWTEDDLKSAVAAYEDPAVRTPVLKLGHTDPRFDGQPAVGRLMNPRLSANGQTLFGDYVGVPVWLAKVMPTAYPRRSVEGWFDMTTRTGHDWPFVLTACALLGEAYPAITTLEDIEAMYGEEPPPLLAVADVPEVLASRETDHGRFICAVKLDKDRERVTMGKQGVQASGVSVSDLVRAFYDTYDGPDYYWWWIREVRVNPQELIVDDDEDSLYRIPWTVSTDDTIVFGDAVEVEIEYVDVAAAADGTPVRVAASYESAKAAKRPERTGTKHDRQRPATMSGHGGEERKPVGLQLSDAAITALGLDPAVATEDEVNAAVIARAEEEPEGGGDGGEGGGNEPAGNEPVGDGAAAPAPATPPAPPTPEPEGTADAGAGGTPPVIPEGMTLVDASTLATLQEGAQAGIELREQQRVAARTRILDDAVKAGKFAPARRAHYEKMLVTDPEGGAAAIASLEPGLIPVIETGYEGGEDGSGQAAAAYPEGWKREIVKANRGSHGMVKVANDR